MMTYPELMLAVAHDRQRELVAEADRARVLKSARRSATARVTRPRTPSRPAHKPAPAVIETP